LFFILNLLSFKLKQNHLIWHLNPQITFKIYSILASLEVLTPLFQIHQPTPFFQQKPYLIPLKVMTMDVTYIPSIPHLQIYI